MSQTFLRATILSVNQTPNSLSLKQVYVQIAQSVNFQILILIHHIPHALPTQQPLQHARPQLVTGRLKFLIHLTVNVKDVEHVKHLINKSNAYLLQTKSNV